MKRTATISAAIATLAIAAITVEHAHGDAITVKRASVLDVAGARGATWRCQDRLHARRTRAQTRARGLLSAGAPYRAWIVRLWRRRATACAAEARRRILPATSDWRTAVAVVQRAFPGTSRWLISCSSSEGGHGGFVMNRQGTDAGGWMQYMPRTFEHDYARAVADARRRRFVIPRAAHSWTSPLGQAIAAGWAYTHDRPAGKWTGATC